MKIALALTSEDMLEILEEAGITITKGELGAVLRKEGHKNYKECLDRYARNFLKGLAIRYRDIRNRRHRKLHLRFIHWGAVHNLILF